MSVQRRRVLESFGNAPVMLGAALRRFPRKMWLYRDRSGGPSIHEIVWHIAESETVEYVHCRRFIVEPDFSTLEIASSRWISNAENFYRDVKEGLGIFRVLRRAAYRFLKVLPENAWTNMAELPILGRLSLERWIEIRESYVPEQILRMERIHSAWVELTSSTKAMQL